MNSPTRTEIPRLKQEDIWSVPPPSVNDISYADKDLVTQQSIENLINNDEVTKGISKKTKNPKKKLTWAPDDKLKIIKEFKKEGVFNTIIL